MDGEARELLIANFDLARMYASCELQSERMCGVAQGKRTARAGPSK